MNDNPDENLPHVPSFEVTSTDVQDGEKMPPPQVSGSFGAGGKDISLQLSWRGFPEATPSFVVTVYDPDAPTASGFWHWAIVAIPAPVTELPRGVGEASGAGLPKGAFQLRNDAGRARYLGAAAPSGHGKHQYALVVHEVDVASLGLKKDATPAFLGFNLFSPSLGRGMVDPWYESYHPHRRCFPSSSPEGEVRPSCFSYAERRPPVPALGTPMEECHIGLSRTDL